MKKPKPRRRIARTEQFSLRIDTDYMNVIDTIAEEEGTSRNRVVAAFIYEKIENEGALDQARKIVRRRKRESLNGKRINIFN